MVCTALQMDYLKPELAFARGVVLTGVEEPVTIPDQFRADILLLLPRLRRFAFSLTRSGPDADDLLQDACISALANWQQYDAAQPFDRWMFRIVRNSWISEIRKRKVRLGEGNVPAEDASELQTEQVADVSLEVKDVMGEVAHLPQELSQPLLLVCAEGYSYQETADLLDVPKGTVMSRIHRARKLLMVQLKEEKGA